jgi:hypothetical protein
MKLMKILTAVLVIGLASCKTIPTERNNNCSCAWEKLNGWETLNTPNQGALA